MPRLLPRLETADLAYGPINIQGLFSCFPRDRRCFFLPAIRMDEDLGKICQKLRK